MSRRQAREIALQALFQLDMNPAEPERVEIAQQLAIEAAVQEQEQERVGKKTREFVNELVVGTAEHITDIDELISQNSKQWKLSRMSGIDRNITRMAVFELRFRDEKTDAGIIINEAVELAKKYGTDDSRRFVNGILGAIVRG